MKYKNLRNFTAFVGGLSAIVTPLLALSLIWVDSDFIARAAFTGLGTFLYCYVAEKFFKHVNNETDGY